MTYAELWILFLAAVATLALTCAVLVIAEGVRKNRAAQARAVRAAKQERADVAGRKANAESVRWVG